MRDLSLHLMDIIQNSISANANKIVISINAYKSLDLLEIKVVDNGFGMDEEFLKYADDPFVTTRDTRKVGLGISLFKASAERALGDLEIFSTKGQGTTLVASFKISHIDRLTLGDIAETLIILINSSLNIEFELVLNNDKESFLFCTAEIKQKLGDVPITEYEILNWIRDYINDGIKTIFGGVLDEIIS